MKHYNNLNNLKVVFAGSPEIGAIILEKLIAGDFNIPLVLTKSAKPAGRGKKPTPTPVAMVAKRNNIPTLSPAKLDSDEFISKLKRLDPDLIIVAAYGKIFPKIILDLPKYGVLNFHPSLLPKFRGPAPIQFAILEGETKTGVTIIKMDENLDEGDILAQKEIKITPKDTTLTLKEKLANLGADLLIEIIPDWVKGKIKSKPQDHLKATYTVQLSKNDGKINLKNPPEAEKFARMVKAFYPWPTVWAEIEIKGKREKESKKLKIKFLPNTQPLDLSDSQHLPHLLIQVEGKKPVAVKDFLNGYPETRQLLEKLQLV